MLRKTFFLYGALAAFLLLTLFFGWRLAVRAPGGEVAPDLVMLLVIFAAMHEKGWGIIAFAGLAGAGCDLLMGGAGLGPAVVCMISAAGFMMFLRRFIFSASLLVEPFLAAAAATAGFLALGAAQALVHSGAPLKTVICRAIFAGIACAIAAPIEFFLLRQAALLAAGSERSPDSLNEWSRARRLHRRPTGTVIPE
jgi:hypothetical protein